MKKQGFGKDDLKPNSTADNVDINTEVADKIIQDVLIGVSKEISQQAGLPIEHEGKEDGELLLALFQGLASVGVQLELSEVRIEDDKPLLAVMVKQTVGEIDLSEAVIKKEEK